MAKTIYLLHHDANESCENNFINEILGAYDTKKGAQNALEQIKNDVDNKTSHYFKDREYGWIAPKLLEDADMSFLGFLNSLVYQWKQMESGVVCFSKFYITECNLYN